MNISRQKTTKDRKRLLFRAVLVLALPVILSGCQTYNFDEQWPSELPPRKVFIKAYLESRGQTSAPQSDLEYHLTWIQRFYQGTTLYPKAWLYASDRFRDSVEDKKERKKVARRMYSLGIIIANEWAKDNDIRLINNSCIATWASAMRTAAERDQQLTFLKQVEDDVAALLDGKITVDDIEYSRYFEDEIYDDF